MNKNMSFKEMLSSIPEGWFEKLEMVALREKGRRHFYERNYSDKMTYDRYVFINNLECEIVLGRMNDDRAVELIIKYDENHNPME